MKTFESRILAYGMSALLGISAVASCDRKEEDGPSKPDVAVSRGSKPDGEGVKSVDRRGLDQAEAAIDGFTTSQDFGDVVGDLASRSGMWALSDIQYDIVFSRFFLQWYQLAPLDALNSARSLPAHNGGILRRNAIGLGSQQCSTIPAEYFDALGEIPEDTADGMVRVATESLLKQDEERCFAFIDEKLGQGSLKRAAIEAFFSYVSERNFRKAVEYSITLAFEEDRRYAYSSFSDPITPPSAEDFDWARQQGVPEKLLKTIKEGND